MVVPGNRQQAGDPIGAGFGRTRQRRAALLCASALQAGVLVVLAVPALAQPAPNARPIGGQVVGGSATIGRSSNVTTITQSSQRAAVDWTSFNVGRDQKVDFQQPSSSAVTLNRVTGPDPSAIAGQITANGQIVLTNASGVMFYKGAQVNAQSLVVSAPGISTANFMAGKMVFDQAPKPGAMVSNAGTITVKQAGLAALVAPAVANSGTIRAPMGRVVLAGAEAHTIDLYGDGLLSIDVTRQVRTAPVGPDGQRVTALVTNTGVIVAEGGQVTLTAAAADGIVQNLVNAGGRIQAASKDGQAGRIEILGTGGSVVVTGQLAARGGPGSSGGDIVVNATQGVTLAPTARVNASGGSGGGTVAIGTTLARARQASVGYVGAAATTTVAKGARISADAVKSGNGGKVVVLGSASTTMNGRITARGGKVSGDGGAVEISGAGGFHLAGPVDVSAPVGVPGGILLDPRNLTITSSSANDALLVNANPNLAYNSPDTTTDVSVSPNAIIGLNGSVHLQASNDLTVLSSIAMPQERSLNLEAGNNLTVAAGVTISGHGQVLLTAASDAIPGFTATGVLSLFGNVSTSATLTLSSQTGGIVLSGTEAVGRLAFDTTGAVTQPGGSVTAGTLSGTVGSLSLGQANAIGGIFVRGLASTVGDLSITEAAGVSFQASGPMTTPAGQTITINADTILAGTGSSDTDFAQPPPITAGTVVFAPVTAGLGVEIIGADSTATAGRLSLSVALLSQVTADRLLVGSAQAGNVYVGLAGDTIAPPTATLGLFGSGAITQGGVLNVGTLTANAASVSLANAFNNIGTLGSVTATGAVAVASGSDMAVSGPVVSTGAGVTLAANSSQLSLAGPVSGTTVGLTAGVIVQQAGSITAGTLNASTANYEGFGSITLAQPGNAIATLGTVFTDTGSVQVVNGMALGVAGPVQSASSVSLSTVHGDLTLAGAISGPDQVNLVSGDGRVVQAGGTIATGLLTGSATSASFGSATNQVAALGNFTTSVGGFSLTDAIPLAISGSVSVPLGQSIGLTMDTLSVREGGALLAQGGTVALAPLTPARPIELAGTVDPTPGYLSLASAVPGSIQAVTLQLTTAGDIVIGRGGNEIDLRPNVSTLSLDSGGVVSEAGTLAVRRLTGAAGSATLDSANTIATLAAFHTGAGLALSDVASLSVTGPVIDDGVGIRFYITGNLGLAGNVSAPTLSLIASGAIAQTAGQIATGTLSGSAGGTASLTNPANAVATLAGFSSVGGLSLADALSLNVPGPLFDATGVTLSTANALTLSGTVNTGVLTLAAASTIGQTSGYLAASLLTGSAGGSVSLTQPANAITTLGAFSSAGGLLLADAVALGVTGPVADATSVSLATTRALTLSGSIATGALTLAGATITQSGGAIAADTLGGSSGGATGLSGTRNAIATLGSFTAGGTLTLTDSSALSLAGPVSAAGIVLQTGGNLGIAGNVTTGGFSFTTAGSVTQTGGALTAATVSGSASGAVLLGGGGEGGTAAIASLGNISTPASLVVADTAAVVLQGPIAASTLAVTAPGRITVSAPNLALGAASQSTLVVTPRPDGSGELLQTGTSVVSGAGSLLLQAPGSISLGQLAAPGFNLVLSSLGGVLGGNLVAANLQVLGSAGSANLFGTVAGVAGNGAAAAATIAPAINARYLLDGCVIGLANCGRAPPPFVPPTASPPSAPAASAVRLITPPNLILPHVFDNLPPLFTAPLIAPLTLTLGRGFDDSDLLLPNISDRDY